MTARRPTLTTTRRSTPSCSCARASVLRTASRRCRPTRCRPARRPRPVSPHLNCAATKGSRASPPLGCSACSTTGSASHATRRASKSALKTRPATVSPFSWLATSRASLTCAGRFSRSPRASRPATATHPRRRDRRRRRHLECRRPAPRPLGNNNNNKLNKPEVAPFLHPQSATLVGATRAGQARARLTAVSAVHRHEMSRLRCTVSN